MFRLGINVYFVFRLCPQGQFSTLLLTLLIRSVLVHQSRLILSTIFLESLLFAKKEEKEDLYPKRGEKRGFLKKRGKRGGVGNQII